MSLPAPHPQYDEASLAKAWATDDAATLVAGTIVAYEGCDWTSEALKTLQAEWKTIGPVSR